MIISIIFLVILMLPRFIRFEKSSVDSGETVLIALFSAVAALARIPFASLPSVQPTSGIIMLVGYTFGPEVGFMVGAISAIASNIVLGQGPWTVWQMFAFGLLGFIAGWLGKKNLIRNRIIFAIIGFVLGFIYGWIMNLWMIIGFVQSINVQSILTIYAASFYFDFLHGLSNAVVIFFAFIPWNKKMVRIRKKYNID